MQQYSSSAILQLFEYGTLLQKRHYQGWKNPPCRYRNIFPATHRVFTPGRKSPCVMRLQHDVLADACSTRAHAGKIFRFLERDLLHSPCRKSCPVPEERYFIFPDAGKGWFLERAPLLHYFLLGNFSTPTENSCGTENSAFEDV
jgi:hypothetical protein